MIALALQHAASRWASSALLCIAVFVMTGLPLVSRVVVSSFEASLRVRAENVPLLVGAAGSRFDLVLAGLHWRVSEVAPIKLAVVEELRAEPGVVAMPVHVRFRARGEPIAAVPFEYFGWRQLVPRDGRLVAGLGEAVVGADVALRLNVAPGDELSSDQRHTYDITGPSSVVLKVVGILSESGTPDDGAVFVDLETAWLLEGIAHGHEDAADIADPEQIIGRSDERTALSGAVIEYQRVDASNSDAFHLHGERSALPITAVLVFPKSDKAEAIVRTRVNANPARQAIDPRVVSEELIGSVLRVRTLVDAIAIVVGAAMLGLLFLVGLLTLRSRSEEIRTLHEIGATRRQLATLFLIEFGGLALIGVLAAIGVAWAASDMASRFVLSLT